MVLDWANARIITDNFGGYGRAYQANSNTNAPAELRFGGFGKHNGKNIEVVFRHKYRSGKDNSVQVRRAAAQ